MGVAHGGDHAAQVAGNGHQGDGQTEPGGQARRFQKEDAEGNEGDEGHVIGDEHAAEKAETHQRQHHAPRRADPAQKLVADGFKDAFGPEAAHNEHQAEQQDQGVPVDVGQVLAVQRHHKAGEYGQYRRNRQDHIFFDNGNEFVEHGFDSSLFSWDSTAILS